MSQAWVLLACGQPHERARDLVNRPTAVSTTLSREVPLHPIAGLSLGNPDDRWLDNVPPICRQNLKLSDGDFDTRYRFVTFERALVGAMSQLPTDTLRGLSQGIATTVVGPVNFSTSELPPNVATSVNSYEALVAAIESRKQTQIVSLELLGRPETEEGERIILIRYVVRVIAPSSEVARRATTRVTLCLMPEKDGIIVAYLENEIQS